jgi:hypothetical protein
MHSGAGNATQLALGFPIRTPWDHSSVDSSPRPIAASHVLHRLLVPRHPPSALDNLHTHQKPQPPPGGHGFSATQKTKMLASTIQFSTHNQPATHPPTPAPNPSPPPTGNQHPTVCRPGGAWHHREPNPETHPTTGRDAVVPSGLNRVPPAPRPTPRATGTTRTCQPASPPRTRHPDPPQGAAVHADALTPPHAGLGVSVERR